MAQSEYLCLERRLRAKQPEEHPPDQVEQVTHRTYITRFGPSRQADGISDSDRICQADLADQLPNFERHLGPAGSPSRLPAPEAAESSTMPSHNRLRPNDCHRIKNGRREPI